MKHPFPPMLLAFAVSILLVVPSVAGVLDHWTKRSSNSVSAVRYVGGLFIAVGPSGMILTSTNGTTWIERSSGTTENLRGAAFGSGRYAVVGGNAFLTSTDGSNWSTIATTNGLDLQDVTHAGGYFVAVGAAGSANILRVDFLVRTNWSAQLLTGPDCSPLPSPYRLSFRKVGVSGGRVLAVGDICTGIWRSLNAGFTWENRTRNQYFTGIAFGNQRTVAVGMEGSPWMSTNHFTTATNYYVNTNAGYFDCDNYYVGLDLVFGDGRFVAVGGCHIIESTNGINWLIHTNVSGLPISGVPISGLRSVAYGAGTFVVAASDGIYQSDSIGGRVSVSTTNPVALLVDGEPNHIYRVQRSTNLLLWSDVGGVTNMGTANPFTDPDGVSYPIKFYRAVTP